MDTVVLAPAGYLIDPDVGSDYERPWRLAQGLAKRGLRVVMVARDAKRIDELGSNIELHCPPGDLPSSPVGRMIDRANLYVYARRVAYRELAAGRASVVHHLGPCSEQSPSLIGKLPIPFVYGPLPGRRPANVQDDEWLSWLRTPKAPPTQARLSRIVASQARPVGHFLWRRMLNRVDAITVESVSNVPNESPKFVVIPPGIDVIQFAPSPTESRVPGRVIAVGRLLARKGYETLLRAIGRLITSQGTAHLLLVGDGPEEQSLKLLAESLGLDRSVTFVGSVPRAQLPSLLRSAEVFCHPATWDNVPFAPLEAMACGLPTVVSASGGLPGIVGNAGVVHQIGDDLELSEILINLLSNSSLRTNLGTAARARILQRFTWDAMCESYVDLYHRLAKGSPPVSSESVVESAPPLTGGTL